MTETTETASADLVLVSNAIVEFSTIDAGIAALTEKFSGVLYDCKTAEGLEAAKAARLTIREPRYAVERIRTAAKRPLVDLGKKLDAEAKRITAALEAIEDPIDAQIKAEEQRREAEKAAKLAAEAARVAKIKQRIEAIRAIATQSVTAGSDQITLRLSELTQLAIDESFGEFADEALRALGETTATLRQLHAAALSREAEARRIEAERAELARLRKEQQERDAVAAAEAEAKRKAEQARQAEEAQRVAEQAAALAAAQRKLDEEREAFERQKAAQMKPEEPQPTPEPVVSPLSAEQGLISAATIAEGSFDAATLPVVCSTRMPTWPPPSLQEVLCVLADHYLVSSDTVAAYLAEQIKPERKGKKKA
jgi:hypothetical protein